ncbi:Mov34/MPN/PAD-1 family protein [Leptolyngbya sp. AN03gr2]|uniref:Mov34/MPN/PAD-1 family protein n=1 Tax=unclassified Leptolyngbya TaxID=2650499 RepID=UPI003D3195DF
MEPLIFQKTDGGKLEIGLKALTKMLRYRQKSESRKEAGGVLMGRYIRDCLDVVIDDVTTPMSKDRRTRFSFFRNQEQHQQILDNVWQASLGTTHYLGEWHTHPEAVPTPSPADLADWQKHLCSDIFSGSTLFFIIVGIESLQTWECHRQSYSKTSKIESLCKMLTLQSSQHSK